MDIKEFSNILYEETDALIDSPGGYSPATAGDHYFIILKAITRLREFVTRYTFENKNEEIHFFKVIKPKFFSRLIYYRKIFDILSNLPAGLPSDISAYYADALDRIRNYIEGNKEFFSYYRSGSTLLDGIYFVRQEADLWLALNAEDDVHNDLTTVYDHKLSKLLAYEKVAEFLVESIRKKPGTESSPSASPYNITWTAPKAALIELLYAVQTSGACNSGTIEVKELAQHFEKLFNVKLGNFYRTFQEIRIRKMSRTAFLDQMKESLVKRMDDSDENPRY